MAIPGGAPREVHNYLGILSVIGGFATPALVFLGAAFKAWNDRQAAARDSATRASLDNAQADFRKMQQGEIERMGGEVERLMRERNFWEMAARRADFVAHEFRHELANELQKAGAYRVIPPVPKLEDKFTEKELEGGSDETSI